MTTQIETSIRSVSFTIGIRTIQIYNGINKWIVWGKVGLNSNKQNFDKGDCADEAICRFIFPDLDYFGINPPEEALIMRRYLTLLENGI